MSEIQVTIIDREGEEHTVSAPTDMAMNLMELVRAYELVSEGTFGICGGMAMCASCQIYIINNNIPLPEKADEEEAMLSEALNVEDNSRLSCQLLITEELNGLKFQLAPAE